MTVSALIPARGGSQGLPGKNLALVGGRSLVARAVDCAMAVPAVDRVVVSSDDAAILDEGRSAGAEALLRPAALATSEAPTAVVIEHFLDTHPDTTVLVLLQPTSPLRAPEDVERCLDRLGTAPAVVTVTPVDHPVSWMFRLGDGEQLDPVLGWEAMVPRRQDAETVYQLNGAVYVATAAHLRAGRPLVGPDTAAVIMPAARSVDVDDRLGLEIARAVEAMGDPGDTPG